jgi:predicted site-specific integrase-resolvase
MNRYSTREAAKKLGLSHVALARYVLQGKIPTPETIQQGKRLSHSWSEEDIEHVRQLLPKIANGRKTRYKKKQLATGSKQLAKRKKPKKK